MLFIYRFSEFNRAKKVASGSAEGQSSLDSFLTKPGVQAVYLYFLDIAVQYS